MKLKNLFWALFVVNIISLQATQETVTLKKTSKKFDKENTIAKKITGSSSAISKETWQMGKIFAASIAAAATYGILNDQVTVRVCPEYFTKGFHETMFHRWPETGPLGTAKSILLSTESPTVIACTWGIVATVEMGILCGLLLSVASRFGERDKKTTKDLIKPLGIGMAATGLCSAIGLGFPLDTKHLYRSDVQGVPEEKITAFCRCAMAHSLAYGVGALTMLTAAGYILHQRLKKSPSDIEKEALIKEIAELKGQSTKSC